MTLHPIRTGFALGSVVGLWHLAWAGLVAVGWAKPLLDFVLWMHFLQFSVSVQPFDAGRAAVLVAVTFGAGFGLGALFAAVWNRLQGSAAAPARKVA